MSTISSSSKLPDVMPQDWGWRLSVEQYHEMARAGILTEDDPVELLEGWLIYKMTGSTPHTLSTTLIRQSLESLIPMGWFVNSQAPLTLEDSEPEPDVIIVRSNPRDDAEPPFTAQLVALVVEVADATLERDRGIKRRIYARAGIPAYWLVNLNANCLEVYTAPAGESREADYRQLQVCKLSDSVPVIIEGQEIAQLAVRELLP